jgi:hypothetical protein
MAEPEGFLGHRDCWTKNIAGPQGFLDQGDGWTRGMARTGGLLDQRDGGLHQTDAWPERCLDQRDA